MEHYKSTLGTTAAAISALVLAAQIMQAGPFAASPPRAERVSASIEATAEETAWVNPPVRTLAEAKPDAAPEEAKSAGIPAVVAPVAAQAVAREAAPAPRKAAAPHRRKVAQRPARTRQATLETRATTETAASQATVQPPQPAEAKRIDPIGDIIRGLGFGGGQG
ncbi:MAG: hypothetical protein WAP03_23505 [Methylorubrum rhodinum]|uniref:hypothetical protein n=1 Tax=Methylorubrum rhodinum TaxID=29428 RepID=UPI003BAFF375